MNLNNAPSKCNVPINSPLTIQLFDYPDGTWRARLAGKGYGSYHGDTMYEVLGQILWEYQGGFQLVRGVIIDHRQFDGSREVWGVNGRLMLRKEPRRKRT